MKVLIAGDMHNNIVAVERAAFELNCDEAIVVGDCWNYTTDADLPIHLILGNHERFKLWENIQLTRQGAGDNVHLHDDYTTFEIDGTTFGVIGRIDEVNHRIAKQYIALGPAPDMWMKKKSMDYIAWLFDGIDVLLTHDGPYPVEFNSPFHVPGEAYAPSGRKLGGSAYLADVVSAVQPSLQVGGHYHSFSEKMLGNTYCVQLPATEIALNDPPECIYVVWDTDTKTYELVTTQTNW